MARHEAGWIKVHRRILAEHSWLGRDGVALGIFVWLLLEANYRDGWHPIRQGTAMRRGQLATSDHEISKRLRIPRTTVKRKLDRMAKEKMLDLDPDHHGTIITVVNYAKYQDFEEGGGPGHGPPADHPRTTRGPIREEEQEEQEEQETPPLRAGAGARNDPGWPLAEEVARQVLVDALSALASPDATEATARADAGELAAAVVLKRFGSFGKFARSYERRISRTAEGMVEAQLRDQFALVLADPRFNPAQVLERFKPPPAPPGWDEGTGDVEGVEDETMGTAENAH